MKYVLRRLAFYLLAAWASLTFNFVIPRLIPGDPAAALVARFKGQLDATAIASLREAFGYTDDPWYVQYLTYVQHLFMGDLGISVVRFPAPVTSVLGETLAWTMLLAGTGVVLAFALGTLLGIVAAWRRGGWLDSVAPPALIFLGAFPYFWLAMLLLYVFGFVLGWFPLRAAYGDGIEAGLSWRFLSSVGRHLVLPAATIVLASLGSWMLSMRNTMIGVLAEDYITMAQAKGLPERRIMFHYAARNALLPNITGFGIALGFVLSGSLLTEIVFSYPGLGYLLLQAVKNKDYPLMQGLFLAITFAVLAANWLVDIAYVWLDPRTRTD
jgi:peptide/nickel transport system permease protein